MRHLCSILLLTASASSFAGEAPGRPVGGVDAGPGADVPGLEPAPGPIPPEVELRRPSRGSPSVSDLVAAHAGPYSLGFGPEFANVSASLSGSLTDSTLHVSFDLTDRLIHVLPSPEWVAVDLEWDLDAEPLDEHVSLLPDGAIFEFVNTRTDSTPENPGWVEEDLELPLGDISAIPGCAVFVSIESLQYHPDESFRARERLTLDLLEAVDMGWVDRLGRTTGMVWSTEDPEPSYDTYELVGEGDIPPAAAGAYLDMVVTTRHETMLYHAPCVLDTTSGSRLTCTVENRILVEGAWEVTPILVSADGTDLCYDLGSFTLELREYEEVDNDADSQSELDGDCDDTDPLILLDPGIADDDCDTDNDNCDTDVIDQDDGTTVTGIVNDGIRVDEQAYGENDTVRGLTVLDTLDATSLTADYLGNLHRDGDQDWYMFGLEGQGNSPDFRVTLEVPDLGTDPDAQWGLALKAGTSEDLHPLDIDWHAGTHAPDSADCDGSTCTLVWTVAVAEDWHDADSVWALGVTQLGAWSPELCAGEESDPGVVYRLHVERAGG